MFGPGAGLAEDLEPEYIAVSADSSTAFVALQENNALGILDIAAAEFSVVRGLGYKDHSVAGNALDASNRDGGEACTFSLEDAEECINIQSWPTLGMFQPDAIATFNMNGADYVISANEGDARDYDGYSEEARVGDEEVVLDPTLFPDAASLKEDAALGRLKTTLASGDDDGDGDIDRFVFLWRALFLDLE